MDVKIVIPARIGSRRLPKKILSDVRGKPLVWRTWRRALKILPERDIFVAVDDLLVQRMLQRLGVQAVMTPVSCANGTERVAEVAKKVSGNLFINIQADEPVFSLSGVRALIAVFKREKTLQYATLAAPLRDAREIEDPNVVKVVVDTDGYALLFSRLPIPFARDAKDKARLYKSGLYTKHIGVYAYTKEFLRLSAKLPPAAIESAEKLEQLRYLYCGKKIKVLTGSYDSLGVDTQKDLERLRAVIV